MATERVRVGAALPEPSFRARVETRPLLVAIWVAFIAGALLLLQVLDGAAYGGTVAAIALCLALVSTRVAPRLRWTSGTVDTRDLRAVGGLYVAVVASFTLAFQVFTTDRTAGLFIAFAGGLVAGVLGPLIYTRRLRQRPLSSLGLGRANWAATAALGLGLAAVQFALTFWGYELPTNDEDWVPLLVMALVVGLFEAIFFRGFIQNRLEASFGLTLGVALAASLYALYHVGYGMGLDEMVFLFGLGLVYAAAFRLVNNVLVLWPLLIPMGSFYNNVEAGDIELPWASLIGFGELLVVMLVAIAVAVRRERRPQ